MPKVAHKKSFRDYLTAEDLLHEAVVKYMKLQYPKVFFIHVPNEGRRTKFERFKAKILGMTSGVPDLLIFQTSDDANRIIQGTANGLAIELKIEPNKPTAKQIACLQKLSDAGWQTHVCYDFDAARKAIDNYLN